MLWGLDRDRVVDPVFRIGPKVGCHLEAGAERDKQAVGDIAFSKAELLGAGPIDFYAQLWCVRHMMWTNVNRARNLFHPRLDLTRDCIVRLIGKTGDLDVDWRRQTEIQNLADDVCRLEIETQLRKTFGEFLPQRFHICRSRPAMIGLERDENLAVGLTDRGVITKGEIDALRYADVVQYQCQIRWRNDVANGFFHIRENLLALFQPRSGRCVDVQTKLARINSWEKIASDDRQNRERAANENKKQDENAQSVLQGPGESIDVTLTKFFESSIKRFLNPGEKIGRRFFAFVT